MTQQTSSRLARGYLPSCLSAARADCRRRWRLRRSQDSFHIPLPPSFELSRARRHHQARHDSWQISQRLVGRAEDAFEELLWQGGDVEEAEIRVRIAREEEEKCRRRVDRAALDITALKRKERAAHAAELSCGEAIRGEPWRSSPPRRRPMPTLEEVPSAEGHSRRSPSKSSAFRRLRAAEEGAAARRAARKAAEAAAAAEAEREIAAAAETMVEEVRKRVELLQAMDFGDEQQQSRAEQQQQHPHHHPHRQLPPSVLPPSMSSTSVRACGCGMLCLCSAVAGLL